jgi:type IV secretory pathway VirB2 component (pilin)
MKKIFLIIFLALFFFSLFPHQIEAGLVPCGLKKDDPDQPGDQTLPCQLCHFFVLFKNIFDFLLFKIVPVLAVLMIAIAGFMFLFAYFSPAEMLPGEAKGGPTLLSRAKKLISSVVFGLLIIYAAWIIVNTFFMVIGVADWTGLKEGWWKINCPTQ